MKLYTADPETEIAQNATFFLILTLARGTLLLLLSLASALTPTITKLQLFLIYK